MTSTALSLATSASSIVEATGLAAQFKSIVPSDLFIALVSSLPSSTGKRIAACSTARRLR